MDGRPEFEDEVRLPLRYFGISGSPAGIGPDGATPAELYALRTGAEPVTVPRQTPQTGMYL